MEDTKYAILKAREIADDMSQALQSLAKSLNKTKSMVDCIKSSKKYATQLKEDIDQLTKAYEAKQTEYNALLKHRNMLQEFIRDYEGADEVAKAIIENTVLSLFIVFNVIKEEELESK